MNKIPRNEMAGSLFIFSTILIILLDSCDTSKSLPEGPYTAFSVSRPQVTHENHSLSGDSIIAQVTDVENYMTLEENFSLEQNTTVNIKATGEGITYKMGHSLFKVWQNDNIEFYFDPNNNKSPSFDIHGDDRQYRICWGSNKITGMNLHTQGVKFRQSDPTNNAYQVEIKFPWKALGINKPTVGKQIGFEIAVADNDGFGRELHKTWHSKIAGIDEKTSLYGVISLQKTLSDLKTDQPQLIAIQSHTPVIDGKADERWEAVLSNDIGNIILGTEDNKTDLSASFKCIWDVDNLYFIVFVTDNDKKDDMGIFVDYGWIENSSGKRIWEMDLMKSSHAGGALKNRYTDTTINLPAGNYTLHYTADESHASNSWDDSPPEQDFYGIVLYTAQHKK